MSQISDPPATIAIPPSPDPAAHPEPHRRDWGRTAAPATARDTEARRAALLRLAAALGRAEARRLARARRGATGEAAILLHLILIAVALVIATLVVAGR
jgi:hypothetical protein